MRTLSVILCLTLVMASGSWAFGGKPQAERGKNYDRIAKQLNLTKEQSEKCKASNEKLQASLKANREEVKQLAEQLKSELQLENPDRNKVHSLIKKISDQRTEMELKRMDSLLEMRKLLTPEQKAKFKEMARPKRGRWGWR